MRDPWQKSELRSQGRRGRSGRLVWLSPTLLAFALSFALLQTGDLSCKSGDTHLSELAVIVDEIDQIVFHTDIRDYQVALPQSTSAALIRAVPRDRDALVYVNLYSESGRLTAMNGVAGGGDVVVPLEAGASSLVVYVKAPGGASDEYNVALQLGCTQCGTLSVSILENGAAPPAQPPGQEFGRWHVYDMEDSIVHDGQGSGVVALEAGTYMLNFSSEDGHINPPTRLVTLVDGQTRIETGDYVDGVGVSIEIGGSGFPPSINGRPRAGYLLQGPSFPDGWTKYVQFQDTGFAPGVYSVTFLEAPGFSTPTDVAPQAYSHGDQLYKWAVYSQTDGEVTVSPQPTTQNFTWQLTQQSGSPPSEYPLPYGGAGTEVLWPLPPGDYTITFSYGGAGYTTPDPVAFTVETGSHETIVGLYESSTGGDVSIEVQNAPQSTWWQLNGPGIQLEGEGDQTLQGLPPGQYYVWWGWQALYDMPPGSGYYDGPNGPWTSASKTLQSGGWETFTGAYSYRGYPDKSQIPTGHTASADLYYFASMNFSDCMKGRDPWTEGTVIDEDGWPTTLAPGGSDTIIHVHAPPGKVGEQTFWLFWKGNGRIRVSGGSIGGVNVGTGVPEQDVVDADGEIGISFTFGIEDAVTGYNGTNWGYVSIEQTDAAPNHLREIEIVHEDYLGPGGKDFRDPSKLMVSEQAREFWKYNRIARFLEWVDDPNVALPPPVEGEYGEVGGPGVWGWDLDYEGPGRLWTSEVHGGVSLKEAWQQKIDLCNATQSDMWITSNPFAENEVIMEKAFELIEADYDPNGRGGLNPALKVYYEYANETWNGIFFVYDYATYWGRKRAGHWQDQFGRPFPDASEPGGFRVQANAPYPATPGFGDLMRPDGTVNSYYGMTRYTAYALWRLRKLHETELYRRGRLGPGQEFETYQDRGHAVLGNHHYNSGEVHSYVRTLVNGSSDASGVPVQFQPGETALSMIDSVSVANYSTPAQSQLTGYHEPWPPASTDDWPIETTRFFNDWFSMTGVANAHPSLSPRFEIDSELWVEHKAAADHNGLSLVAYEGGTGWANTNRVLAKAAVSATWSRHLVSDPRLYEHHRNIYDISREIGFQEMCHFGAPSSWKDDDNPGYWGVRETFNSKERTSWKWMAYVDWLFDNPKWW